MSLLPIFLKLEHRPGLLVGAGAVALEKISSLLKTGLRLRVVAPKAKAEVRQLATEGKLEWIERPFYLSDLDGNFLVIAATDSAEVNAAVYRGAVERGILVNSVDDPPQCDFYFGSVIERGRLQVAISTAGQSPAVATNSCPRTWACGWMSWEACAARFSQSILGARRARRCCIGWPNDSSAAPPLALRARWLLCLSIARLQLRRRRSI